MAFLLSFERTHRVVRATASGVVATQHLLDLDLALVTFLAREEAGGKPPIRGLFDFSQAVALAVPEAIAAHRASRPAIVRGQRVMVTSHRASCSLVECFVRSESLAGGNPLAVVGSIHEAHALLGMKEADYEAVG